MSSVAPTTGVVEVKVETLAGQDYLGSRFSSRIETVGGDVEKALAGLYTKIQAAGAAPSGPPFLIASPPSGGSMTIEVGAPCAPVPEPGEGQHRGHLEPTTAVIALYRGPYAEVGPAYETAFSWAAAHGYRPLGPPREVYLNGPDEVASPADYITQIVVPVATG